MRLMGFRFDRYRGIGFGLQNLGSTNTKIKRFAQTKKYTCNITPIQLACASDGGGGLSLQANEKAAATTFFISLLEARDGDPGMAGAAEM